METLLPELLRAARLSEAVRAEAARPDALAKEDRSPVTIADFAVQALLCRAVRAAFPGEPIVGEERSDALRRDAAAPLLDGVVRHVRAALGEEMLAAEEILGWIDLGGGEPEGRFWTLDPIDGTKGFLRGDQYATALARIEGGAPTLAFLLCSAYEHAAGRGLLLVAERGAGCHLLALDGAPLGPARVSDTADPRRARLAESVESAHSDHGVAAALRAALAIEAPPRRMDSQAKYAAVALGEADVYLRAPTAAQPDYREMIWDHAAGALIVEEAGGAVTDLDGRTLDWTRGRRLVANRGILATNGALHPNILSTLRNIETLNR